jgi:hypothetical protein
MSKVGKYCAISASYSIHFSKPASLAKENIFCSNSSIFFERVSPFVLWLFRTYSPQ